MAFILSFMKLANHLKSYRDTIISFSLPFKTNSSMQQSCMMNTGLAGSCDERWRHSVISVQWDEEMIMNGEVKWINKAIIVYFKVQFRHMHRITEEPPPPKKLIQCCVWDSNRIHCKLFSSKLIFPIFERFTFKIPVTFVSDSSNIDVKFKQS